LTSSTKYATLIDDKSKIKTMEKLRNSDRQEISAHHGSVITRLSRVAIGAKLRGSRNGSLFDADESGQVFTGEPRADSPVAPALVIDSMPTDGEGTAESQVSIGGIDQYFNRDEAGNLVLREGHIYASDAKFQEIADNILEGIYDNINSEDFIKLFSLPPNFSKEDLQKIYDYFDRAKFIEDKIIKRNLQDKFYDITKNFWQELLSIAAEGQIVAIVETTDETVEELDRKILCEELARSIYYCKNQELARQALEQSFERIDDLVADPKNIKQVQKVVWHSLELLSRSPYSSLFIVEYKEKIKNIFENSEIIDFAINTDEDLDDLRVFERATKKLLNMGCIDYETVFNANLKRAKNAGHGRNEIDSFEFAIFSTPMIGQSEDLQKIIEQTLGYIDDGDFTIIKKLITYYERRLFKSKESDYDYDLVVKLGIKDIDCMLALAQKEPGAIQILNKVYGIRNFGRYPLELLIEQARDESEQDDTPYGIAVMPYADHNGAFHFQDILGSKKILPSTFEQLKGSGFKLRVAEAGSKIDIARRLITFDRKYGKKNKISFMILGGHGSNNSIQFGDDIFSQDQDIMSLFTVDLLGKGIQRAAGSHFFTESPTVILDSCSTGAKNGIAKGISMLTGGDVIGPELDTPGGVVDVEIINGKPIFKVRYFKGDTKKYNKGVSVS
jgi:hypothetical protein